MSKKILVSTKCGSDVVIGQEFDLIITLQSDDEISDKAYVSISMLNYNSTLQGGVEKIASSDDKIKKFRVKLRVSSSISVGDLIDFNIIPSTEAVGFSQKEVKYTAREIYPDSLSIYFKKGFLKYKNASDDPDSGNYSKGITIVKDYHDTTLSGVPIAILETVQFSFDKVNIYEKDRKTKVDIHQISSTQRGFYINADKNGYVEFYVYPKGHNSLFFQVESVLLKATNAVQSTNGIFIIQIHDAESGGKFSSPIIEGYNPGTSLVSKTPDFTLDIPKYKHILEGDNILLFVDGIYVDKYITVASDGDIAGISQNIPYDIFPIRKKSELSYWVISALYNSSTPSEKLDVYYIGGANNQPPPVKERNYDPCVVYDSEGNLISSDHFINCETICHYLHNENHVALFVDIKGTNRLNDSTKPLLGSAVQLRVFITSDGSPPLVSTLPGTIPSDPDVPGGDSAIARIGVPHSIIAHRDGYVSGKLGAIEFDYYVDEKGDRNYGKVWYGSINTVPDGATDCTDYD
ncbi:hypothetical protein [Xenorhabdus stockiae]|uniref:hypothetical protein n=1 Tax=Xenorhabdus stockiae TaxID=351614 RepID=UPI0040631C02